MREWIARITDWLRRDTLDRELREELDFHRAQLQRDAAAAGGAIDPSTFARRQLGSELRVLEAARERWSVPALDTAWQDLRYAVRSLRRVPLFAAAVVLTLGLGIGANAAMFGVIDRLMFRPLGLLRDPESVHRVYLRWNDFARERTGMHAMPYARFADLRRWTTAFSHVAAFHERRLAVGSGAEARVRAVGIVTPSFFQLFEGNPVLGRYFTESEDLPPRGADVAVLSYDYWQSEFGGADVLGKLLLVGNVRATVIGVAPKGLTGVDETDPPAAWIPMSAYGGTLGPDFPPSAFFDAYLGPFAYTLVRRKPGVSLEQAAADVSQAFRRSWTAQRERDPSSVPSIDYARPSGVVGGVREEGGPTPSLQTRTMVLVGAVAVIVLLIACANITSLYLGRALHRQRESAMRLALGVSRGRLLRQSMMESFVLAVVGALAGLAVAQGVGTLLHRLLLADGATRIGVIDLRTLGVITLLALLVGVLTGLAPAVLNGRGDVARLLREGTRGNHRSPSRLREGLLVVQGALSVALLVSAALFVRSLEATKVAPTGYDAAGVVIVDRHLRGAPLDDSADVLLRRRLLEAAQSEPGVEYASWTTGAPLWGTPRLRFSVPGVDSVQRLGEFSYQMTTPDYFRVMRTKILRGRGLSDADRAGAPLVAVVSDGMARVLWPGQEALGQCMRIRADTLPCTTVVGVAEDIMQRGPTTTQRYHTYLPIDQSPGASGTGMLLRIRGDPSREAERVRGALQRVMPGDSYLTVKSLQDLVETSRRPWQLGATTFVAFGVLALIVAAVGVYGVIGYNVEQRWHELGVRVALGARLRDVVRLVVGESVVFALAGIAGGVLLALAAGRWLQPLLFEQSARDPLVFGGVAMVMLMVALAASAGPAIRATRVNPTVALREE